VHQTGLFATPHMLQRLFNGGHPAQVLIKILNRRAEINASEVFRVILAAFGRPAHAFILDPYILRIFDKMADDIRRQRHMVMWLQRRVDGDKGNIILVKKKPVQPGTHEWHPGDMREQEYFFEKPVYQFNLPFWPRHCLPTTPVRAAAIAQGLKTFTQSQADNGQGRHEFTG